MATYKTLFLALKGGQWMQAACPQETVDTFYNEWKRSLVEGKDGCFNFYTPSGEIGIAVLFSAVQGWVYQENKEGTQERIVKSLEKLVDESSHGESWKAD